MRACPRCKTQLPDSAALCVACGMRLTAQAPAAPKPAENEANPAAAAKTAFGIASPIRPPGAPQVARQPAYPVAARPAQPVAQPAPPASQEESAAPKTIFGVGAVAPVSRAPVAARPAAQSVAQPAPQPVAQPAPASPQGENSVLPSTLFGVGAAAPVAPTAAAPTAAARPAYTAPAPQALVQPPQAQPEPQAPPEPVPVPKSTGLESTLFSPNGEGLPKMTRAKAAPQPASEDASLSRPSSEEREIIGDGGDLPDVPGEIVDGFAPMPEAPAGFPALLSYFFRALNAKADRIIGVRRLENESKLWEVRAQHLRAVLGYRALQAGFAQGPAAGLKPKADEFAGRIRDLAQKLLAASGEKGQQIKALESAEVQLVAQRKKQEEDLKTLTRQLEDIDVERKQLNKEVDAAQKQGKAPPQMVFDRLQMTQGPYDELKRGVVQAQQSLAASDAGIEKNRKDRKKIAQELEALQRTSTATINATRAEFARHLAPVGEEALNAQHALSGPFRERLAEIDAGISARRTRAARYREESESVDKAKFQQGALGVGGAFVVLLVLLVVLRFI